MVLVFLRYGGILFQPVQHTGLQGVQAGAVLADPEGLIVHELPDEEGLARCEELGKQLAAL